MIDTHCHLDFDSFTEDREQVLQRARLAGVRSIINPAVDLESCEAALSIHLRWPQVHVAVGIHPNSCQDFDDACIEALHELAGQPGVVAVGEIGLDFYRDRCPPDLQRTALRSQLRLAAECNLPVIIHNREAAADLLPMLTDHAKSLSPTMRERVGVLHSFSASGKVARQALDHGYYLGFTGPVTFRKAEDLRGIARQVPLDRLLVETDAPFLAPSPKRGRRNEPSWLPYIVDRLAGLHGVSTEKLAQITEENARRLFNLPD
ncbi:MAG: TatD family hydrolase [Anaerolineaceae bacterium]|nr:TatD family hydrolase [Anaerolineaceae bacterium]